MKYLSKFISLLLVFVMLLTLNAEIFAASAFNFADVLSSMYNTTKQYSDDDLDGNISIIEDVDSFNREVIKLINNDNDYLSRLVIDVDNNTISKDNDETISLSDYDISYDDVYSKEPIIPVVPVLSLLGEDAKLDGITGEIVVTDDGAENRYSFGEDVATNNDEDYNKNISNGIEYITSASGSYKKNVGFMDFNQAENEFLLESEYNDGKIYVTAPYQTKRLIVQSKNGVIDELYNPLKVISNGKGYYIIQYASEIDAKNAYEAFKGNKNISYCVVDKTVKNCKIEDRESSKTIQSDRFKSYLSSNNQDTEIIVAVIDTGADINHEFLKDRMVNGYDVYTGKGVTGDVHGHGTHVSGIIVDNTNDNVKIMPVKVLSDYGSGDDLAVAQGIDYAVNHGAKVINMSLGGECDDENCPINISIQQAVKKGVCVVVAAGNETDDTSKYCPAGIEECITVASSDSSGSFASTFSNYGKEVDVTAPGEKIESAKSGGGYVKMSGTSMATPFVAASAALLLTNEPTLKPQEIENRLKSLSSDIHAKGNDIYSGAGVINFGKFFGDNIAANKIELSSSNISMKHFSKAVDYFVCVRILADGSLPPTDRTFTFKSTDENVAIFSGSRIQSKGGGKAQIIFSKSGCADKKCNVVVQGLDVWIDYAASKYESGTGSKSSPYLIKNANQLAKFALDHRNGNNFKNKYFKLANDIDLAGKLWITATYETEGISIDSDKYFQGHFDGNNHKIKNLNIFNESISGAWSGSNSTWFKGNNAFIGNITNGSISNLGLVNMYFSSLDSGPLVYNVDTNSKITNCYTTGFSAGCGMFHFVNNYDIVISNCYSSATVLSCGIASVIYSSGVPQPTTITNTFFCGELLGCDRFDNASGFGNLIESFVSANQTNVINCFTAAVSPTHIGFANDNLDAFVSNCYYNKLNSISINKGDSSGVSPKSVSFFKAKSSFTKTENWNEKYKWDFTNTWDINPNINNGYPYFKNNVPDDDYVQVETGTWYDYASDNYDGGDGSAENPFLISTPEQLARISYVYRMGGGQNTHFKLTNDIDLSGHEWYPIGAGLVTNNVPTEKDRHSFYGNIDGNGNKILNLKIKSASGRYNGFISKCESDYVKNIEFIDCDVNGARYTGIIAGNVGLHGKIYNCTVIGNVSGLGGGVAGKIDASGYVYGIKSYVTPGSNCGGIAHYCYGVIENCSYFGDKEAMVIYQASGQVINSFTTKTDLIKYLFSAEIINCYSNGKWPKIYVNNKFNQNGYLSIKESDLRNKETFSSFDFDNVWAMKEDENNGFPFLIHHDIETQVVNLPKEKWFDFADINLPGEGTKLSPYLISTPQQLAGAMFKLDDNIYFRLLNNIDLSGKIWNSQYSGGGIVKKFYFDGNNKTIYNLTTKNGDGLFSDICSDGEIKNLNIENIIGRSCAGLLNVNSGIIRNCSVKANVCSVVLRNNLNDMISDVGGICIYNSGTIDRCSFEGNAAGDDILVSGIAAYSAPSSIITNCFTSGTIRANGHAYLFTQLNNETNSISIAKTIGSQANCKDEKITEKKNREYYSDYDFDNIWDIDSNINDGYPFLVRTQSKNISFELNGGTVNKYTEKDYIPGIERILLPPKKTGYAFDGWYKDSSLTSEMKTVGKTDTDDLNLYAKWSKGYTIKFNCTSGSGKMDALTVPTGKTVNLPNCKFTNAHGTFKGWSTSKDSKVVYKNKAAIKDIAAENETITLYAVWGNEFYYIKYDINGGVGDNYLQQVFVDEENYIPGNFSERNGYIFTGWSTNPNGPAEYKGGELLTKRINDNFIVTLYAVWKKITSINIVFNANGGTGQMSTIKYTNNGPDGKLTNSFKRTGYTFKGWATTKDGSVKYKNGTQYSKISCNGSSITLYAVWEANKYTIEFNANGGKGTMKDQSATYDKSIKLTSNSFTAPTGYKFNGWSTTKEGSAKYKNGASVKNLKSSNGSKIILYAVWARYVKVTFNLNGVSGKMDGVTIVNTQKLPVLSVKEPANIHFMGWSKKKDGRVDYKNGGYLDPTDLGLKTSLTLYAVWKKYDYVVKFNANGGSGKTDNVYMKYNESGPIENHFTPPTGKHFIGWATTKDGKVKYDGEYYVKNLTKGKSITLYAKWASNSYTISFNANGGSGSMSPMKMTYGVEKTLTKNSFKAPKGKKFGGWATSKDGKVVYKNAAKVKNLTSKHNGKITLYAKWIKA